MKPQEQPVLEIPPYREPPPFHGGRWGWGGAVAALIATAVWFDAVFHDAHPSIGGAGAATAMITMPVGAFVGWLIGRIRYERKLRS